MPLDESVRVSYDQYTAGDSDEPSSGGKASADSILNPSDSATVNEYKY